MIDIEAEVYGDLRAPFPWFGGKRRVAHIVWGRFGEVDSYNEPFAGSLAVLLGRPHRPRVETVNDLDCFIANFWRALQADPDAVAYFADGPVNEADLHARHRWLVTAGRRRVLRCLRDPHYFNAKIAGWWVWGQCLWIGSGWCEAQRPPASGRRPEPGLVNPKGVHRQFDRNPQGTAHQKRRPHLTRPQGVQRTAATRSGENPSEQHKRFRTDGDTGVHKQKLLQKRPGIAGNGDGLGVHRAGLAGRRWQGGGQGGGSGVHAPRLWQQIPDLSGDSGATGRGVHRGGLVNKLPALSQGGNDRSGNGRGLLSEQVRTEGLYDYLASLAARLRRVRVCCGDWRRVLTPSVTTYIGVTGVFLDPPYNHDLRERCYAEDHNISAEVRAWALEHGDDPKLRIALCGYEGEHEMPGSWDCVAWKAHGGYSRSERGRANRERERIWFSPHCLRPELPLFEGMTA